jgi:hypothetical protein
MTALKQSQILSEVFNQQVNKKMASLEVMIPIMVSG